MHKKALEFEVDGLTLRGNLYLPKQPKKLAVLFLHGWTGAPNEAAAEVLTKKGFSAMTFSLSGHNNSDGKIADQTRQKSLKEIVTAYDLFKSKLPSETKIVAAGTSYGSYMAILLSAERAVSSLSLRVPANYQDNKYDDPQVGQGADNPEVVEWRKLKLAPGETKSLIRLHEFNGPIQIIEAEMDERLTRQSVQNYVDVISDKSKLDYHFMKGWPHSLGDDPERNRRYQKLLLDWLVKQL